MVVKMKQTKRLSIDNEGKITLEGKVVDARSIGKPFAIPISSWERSEEVEAGVLKYGMKEEEGRLVPGIRYRENADAYVCDLEHISGSGERFLVVQAYKICEESGSD